MGSPLVIEHRERFFLQLPSRPGLRFRLVVESSDGWEL